MQGNTNHKETSMSKYISKSDIKREPTTERIPKTVFSVNVDGMYYSGPLLDRFTKEVTAFDSFGALLEAGNHGYCPSFYADESVQEPDRYQPNLIKRALADCYDTVMEDVIGCEHLRAFRGANFDQVTKRAPELLR